MTQIVAEIKSNIQEKAIALLGDQDVRLEMFFGFGINAAGEIEPLFLIADSVPQKEKVYREMYDLLNKYFNFQRVKDTSTINGRVFKAKNDE